MSLNGTGITPDNAAQSFSGPGGDGLGEGLVEGDAGVEPAGRGHAKYRMTIKKTSAARIAYVRSSFMRYNNSKVRRDFCTGFPKKYLVDDKRVKCLIPRYRFLH